MNARDANRCYPLDASVVDLTAGCLLRPLLPLRQLLTAVSQSAAGHEVTIPNLVKRVSTSSGRRQQCNDDDDSKLTSQIIGKNTDLGIEQLVDKIHLVEISVEFSVQTLWASSQAYAYGRQHFAYGQMIVIKMLNIRFSRKCRAFIPHFCPWYFRICQ